MDYSSAYSELRQVYAFAAAGADTVLCGDGAADEASVHSFTHELSSALAAFIERHSGKLAAGSCLVPLPLFDGTFETLLAFVIRSFDNLLNVAVSLPDRSANDAAAVAIAMQVQGALAILLHDIQQEQ